MNPSPSTQLALLLSMALLAVPLAAGAAGPKPTLQPALQAQLVLEKPRILLGEPIYLRFVVKNPTPVVWQTAEGGNQRNRLHEGAFALLWAMRTDHAHGPLRLRALDRAACPLEASWRRDRQATAADDQGSGAAGAR